MTRAQQELKRKQKQGWCPTHYTGSDSLLANAQCKLPVGHGGPHATGRVLSNGKKLARIWPS